MRSTIYAFGQAVILLFVSPLVVIAQVESEVEPQSQDTESSIALETPTSEEDHVTSRESNSDGTSDVSVEETSSCQPTFWATREMDMQFGLQFNAGDNYCTALHATLPFPMTWPEQVVDVIGFDMPELARHQLRSQKQGAGEIVIDMERMSPSDVFDAIGSVRIKKSFIKAPDDPSLLKLPFKPQADRELVVYLGDSPYIETKTRQIRLIASELRDAHPDSAWEHVEAIYDYVRQNVQYKKGEIRSSTQALKDKTGDCEEMTSIFIAICRATGIPARCVWVPDHCYPEFYLEFKKGTGFWFPCQVAGDHQFGSMNEYRPILQKGDRFKTPESKKEVRYLAETFTCKLRSTGAVQPFVKQIRDLGPLKEEIEQLDDGNQQTPIDATSSDSEMQEGDQKNDRPR